MPQNNISIIKAKPTPKSTLFNFLHEDLREVEKGVYVVSRSNELVFDDIFGHLFGLVERRINIFILYLIAREYITKMLQMEQPERGRYQYTTQELTKYMKFQQFKHTSLECWLYKFTALLGSTIVAHQLIYLVTPLPHNHSRMQNIRSTIRPMEHTFTVFGLKLVADLFEERMRTKWSEYKKGGASGLLGYLISRPFDQMEFARHEIKKSQSKIISRSEALRAVIRHDGFRGLYKNENMLAPLSATIYRSTQFGMWNRLNSKYENKLLQLLAFPGLASLSASIATMIPDKCRAFCFQINEERSKSIERKYRKEKVDLKPVITLLLEYICSKEFMFTRVELAAIGVSVLKNWLVLSLFGLGQWYVEMGDSSTRKSIE